MKRLVAQHPGEGLRARGDGFYTLLRAVVGQQISVKAADSVWAKVEKLVEPVTPQSLLKQSDAALRACGLSGQKVAYARNVAEFFVARGIATRRASLKGEVEEGAYWGQLTDEEIIAQLTAIKGIGSWTAEMFLIFHLLRPNVLPLKDLGLLKAMNLHYVTAARLGDKKWLKPSEYEAIAEKWSPYRSVATWYLWRSLDPVAVAY
ncbi:MAG: DNA-3-methyladenine glycosylase 2 family protein [Alphaproteobacteria bacterium]|nr:DNA-3-methyladenine glycosylase 2 family protein [Alphaproteobacteria bacterium]